MLPVILYGVLAGKEIMHATWQYCHYSSYIILLYQLVLIVIMKLYENNSKSNAVFALLCFHVQSSSLVQLTPDLLVFFNHKLTIS